MSQHPSPNQLLKQPGHKSSSTSLHLIHPSLTLITTLSLCLSYISNHMVTVPIISCQIKHSCHNVRNIVTNNVPTQWHQSKPNILHYTFCLLPHYLSLDTWFQLYQHPISHSHHPHLNFTSLYNTGSQTIHNARTYSSLSRHTNTLHHHIPTFSPLPPHLPYNHHQTTTFTFHILPSLMN